MCWSAEVSFATYAFALLCSGILWWRNRVNDRWHAVFAIAFGSMQLLEGVIWTTLNTENESVLRVATNLIWPVVYLNPLACVVGYDVERSRLRRDKAGFELGWWSKTFAAIFLACTVFDLVSHNNEPARQGAGGHLSWPPIDSLRGGYLGLVYPLGMLFPAVFMRPRGEAVFFSFLGPFSVILAFALFRPFEDNEYGSVWCHLANAYSAIATVYGIGK
ncbi:hypothetical protein DIPPA_09146 [Diplonema papillatum]|nr:hypothetical protein DIPPA_09146 [Diplonema papillatum]|eukprot:gene2060-3152_t